MEENLKVMYLSASWVLLVWLATPAMAKDHWPIFYCGIPEQQRLNPCLTTIHLFVFSSSLWVMSSWSLPYFYLILRLKRGLPVPLFGILIFTQSIFN